MWFSFEKSISDNTHTHTKNHTKQKKEKKFVAQPVTTDDGETRKQDEKKTNKWDNDNKPDQSLSFSYFQAVDLITLDTGTYSVRLFLFLSSSISSIFQWNNDVENQRERERDAHTKHTTTISLGYRQRWSTSRTRADKWCSHQDEYHPEVIRSM